MNRSLTFVCILASGFGATALAQASSAAPAAPMPSAPAPASAAAVAATPAKVAIIQFQQAVGATNEGQRDFAELRKKFEPKQNQLKSQSDEIDALKKQLQTQSATMSDTARADLTRSIDEKTKSLQRSAEIIHSNQPLFTVLAIHHLVPLRQFAKLALRIRVPPETQIHDRQRILETE